MAAIDFIGPGLTESTAAVIGDDFHVDPGGGIIVDDPAPAPAGIPVLNSLPGAPVNIYLDFDGFEELESPWPGSDTPYAPTPRFSIDGDPDAISEVERRYIYNIWATVAEDFSPFNVNVTTVDPGDFSHGSGNLRVAIGGTDPDTAANVRGRAPDIDAFTKEDVPNVVFVYPFDVTPDGAIGALRESRIIADTASHEVGHAFGLEHLVRDEDGDGVVGPTERNTGDPPTGIADRAPLMGDSSRRTQGVGRGVWWLGNNLHGVIQDDMAILARPENGFGYRPDDHSRNPTPADASPMTIGTLQYAQQPSTGVLIGSGVIEHAGDADVFQFETGGGDVAVRITGPKRYIFTDPAMDDPVNPLMTSVANLRVNAAIYNSSGEQVAYRLGAPLNDSLPTFTLLGNGSLELPADVYYLIVAGSQYGDAGQYTLHVAEDQGPRIVHSTFIGQNGSSVGLAVTFDEPVNPLSFTPADIRLNGAPEGEGVLGVTQMADAKTYLISWAPTNARFARVDVGPDIADQFGNRMDQNQDGTGGQSDDRVTAYLTSRAEGGFVGGAIDPTGLAMPEFVAAGSSLPAEFRFVNDPSQGGAPAHEVVITHQLDADLDWSTFTFDDLGWGPMSVEIPEGAQSFSTRVEYVSPMRDNTPLLVDIAAQFDLLSGLATWTFRSIDPATGLPPGSVFDGFLPPNDASHLGEGFVRFSAQTRHGLATGAEVEQRALISMNGEQPVETAARIVLIDAEAPTSSVTPLPADSHFRSFPVAWSGADRQGAVAAYDVYVSVDNGPFALWRQATMASADVYTGAFGHSYAFYSVAIDGAGNREAPSGAAQAATRLVDPATVEFVNGQIVVHGGPDFDSVVFFPGAANQVLVRVNATTWGPFLAPTRLVAFGEGGNDRILVERAAGMPAAELHGGAGRDRLFGGFGNDALFGDAGRDFLDGGYGHDRMFGGDDDDSLLGGFGHDVLHGEGGNDRLRGYAGNDMLFGGLGRDYMIGDDGHNVLVGGDGADRMSGASGRNILIGGQGRDYLHGGDGGAILIGGETAHDADEAALLAILSEWSSSRNFSDRRMRLAAGVGAGQFALVPSTTVEPDALSNVLETGGGEDWCFRSASDTLIDFDASVDQLAD